MDIVVIYKKSMYELYYLDKTHSSGLRKNISQHKAFCACLRKSHEQHQKTLARVEQALKKKGLAYKKIWRGAIIKDIHADLVICVGGDGTLLNASHFLKKGELFLVNSDPGQSESFYSSCTKDDFEKKLGLYLTGRLHKTKIHRLEIILDNKELKEFALNDLLIAHCNPAVISRYSIKVGTVKEEQKSSGIWIAAPGGTTAAIQSAGGRPLPITARKFEYLVRELYHGKNRLRLVNGILNEGEELSLTSKMRKGKIFIDGRYVWYDFPLFSTVQVRLAKEPITVLGFEEKKRKRYVL
ncbi:MAG: hypothetical protein V1743_00700 [Nanoarchaeota archaeon]